MSILAFKSYKNDFQTVSQKYDLNNLPPLSENLGWVIEQYFLRHIKHGVIPNLSLYLKKLNADDWTCLLAENPRSDFFKYLTKEMKADLDWEYILDRQKCLSFNYA